MKYTIDEMKIHEKIYLLFDDLLLNSITKVRLLQGATSEIIKEIDEIINGLNEKLREKGLKHEEFRLKQICNTTKNLLVKLIMNREFQEYRATN